MGRVRAALEIPGKGVVRARATRSGTGWRGHEIVARRCVLLVVALLLLASVFSPALATIDGPGDFGLIGRHGFEEVVDGAFPTLTFNPLGEDLEVYEYRRNNYPWSGAWFNGSFYVGTARDVSCFLGLENLVPEGWCDFPTVNFGGFVLSVPTSDQRAEIWRYTPAGAGGLSGIWERVHQSPILGSPWTIFLGDDVPADIGYRDMEVCNAGGTSRLYATTSGLPGRIVYWTGSTFAQASIAGLRASPLDFFNLEGDFGYRSLVCFKGRLWTSPAASAAGDTDISDRPVVLVNQNPVDLDEPWKEASAPGFGNPDNVGVFQMATFDHDEDGTDDYLVAGTFNRTTGAELWWTDASDCDATTGLCSWTKLLDRGAGRPVSLPGFPEEVNEAVVGPEANAVVGSIRQFGDRLYAEMTEAAAVEVTMAELIRIDGDGSWELVMGAPRLVPAEGVSALPGVLQCTPERISGNDFCLPLSGYGLGFGESIYDVGEANYVWRMEEHGGELFGGTLHVKSAGTEPGFDIWKTPDGSSWTRIVDDGLGNPFNNGIRTLVSTPTGLFVGGANPRSADPDGGLEMFLAPGATDAPPVADAGPDRTIFDDDQNGSVTFLLDGGDSYDTFGGTIVAYAWYEADLTEVCDAIVATPISETVTASPTVPAGSPTAQYAYTLRVEDDMGESDCDAATISTSSNLPPVAEIFTVPPAVPGAVPRIHLADFDGNGTETFWLSGRCVDPEGQLLLCDWTVDPGMTLDPVDGLEVTATVLSEEFLAGQDLSPDIVLEAIDDLAFSGSAHLDAKVEKLVDNPEGNNRPECRSAQLMAFKNSPLIIQPASGTPVLCRDPDNAGSELTFEILSPALHGTVDPRSLIYTPPVDFLGRDMFTFKAIDPDGLDSGEVAVGIEVAECRVGPIELTIDGETFPGPGEEVRTACSRLLAANSTVVGPSGHATFVSGSVIALGDGFIVEADALFEAVIDTGISSLENPVALEVTAVADRADVSTAGEVIAYGYTIANVGNVTLTAIALSDSEADADPLPVDVSPPDGFNDGDLDLDNELDLTEVWEFVAGRTVTQDDIDAGTPIVNLATATSRESAAATASDPVSVVQAPAYTLEKTVTDVDGSGPGGVVDAAGDVISYEIVLVNTGNVTLTGVVVSDPLLGGVLSGQVESEAADGRLEVGETWTFGGGYTVLTTDIDTNGDGDGDIDNEVSSTTSELTAPQTASREVPIVLP